MKNNKKNQNDNGSCCSSARKVLIIGLLLLIAAVFLSLVFVRLFAGDRFQKKIEVNRPVQVKPRNVRPSCAVEKPYVNQTRLSIKGEKLIADEVEIRLLKVISDPSEFFDTEIRKVDINPATGKVAYVAEIFKGDEEGKERLGVYLFDLKTGDKILVYEKETAQADESGDYFLGIKDIGFSEDGSLLSITTATGALIYDMNTRQMTTLFEFPPKDPDEMGVYAFLNPKFSPDKSLLLITKGYYEGSSTKVFDIANQRFLEVEFGGYVCGKDSIGWYQSSILVSRYGDCGLDEAENGIYLVDPKNPAEEELIYRENEFEGKMFIDGDFLYYLNLERKPSGYVVCNNVGSEYEVTSSFQILNRLNLKTLKSEEIFRLDSTTAKELPRGYYFERIGRYRLGGEERLIVVILSQGKYITYLVDESQPFALTELVF